jgi:excisionase family DNA binding protein
MSGLEGGFSTNERQLSRVVPGYDVTRRRVEMSESIPRLLVSPVGNIYDTEEAAELLKTSPRTIQRMIRDGRLKSHKVGCGYRILARDIEAFFAQQDTHAENPPPSRRRGTTSQAHPYPYPSLMSCNRS